MWGGNKKKYRGGCEKEDAFSFTTVLVSWLLLMRPVLWKEARASKLKDLLDLRLPEETVETPEANERLEGEQGISGGLPDAEAEAVGDPAGDACWPGCRPLRDRRCCCCSCRPRGFCCRRRIFPLQYRHLRKRNSRICESFNLPANFF